ncbi:MAG: glycosyltransferase family 2 protein [Xanthobacteraceae bacterium]|nr:glycosyltransferase family 2 protein [Xanthobacteraceae bacterium]
MSDLDCRFAIELLLDGVPVKLARADGFVQELARKKVGDGCYGFTFTLSNSTLCMGVVEARLANSGVPLAAPIVLNAPVATAAAWPEFGEVHWLGGLRYNGWCNADGNRVPVVTAMIDGETVARTEATLWSHQGSGASARAVRGFDLHLPDRFADGRVRRVRFFKNNETEIGREPLAHVAFPDGLARTLEALGGVESERLRGALFDRLVPMSLPLSDYRRWSERFPIETKKRTASTSAIAVVLVGAGSEAQSLQSIESQGYAEWLAAAMPDTDEPVGFDPELLAAFLENEAGGSEIIVFSLNGTRFAAHSLQRIANAFAEFADADALYSDVEIEREDGTVWPVAFTAFDYERMLEQGYCAHLFALRRRVVEAALKTGTSTLYRLFNYALDGYDGVATNVVHIPGSLGVLRNVPVASARSALAAATREHLKARGIAARVAEGRGTLFPAVRVARPIPRGSTTVVIPVRDKPELLQTCLNSIRHAVAKARAEIMIIDNDSSDPAMLEYLETLEGRTALVVRVPGYFNFSRLNNIAAEKAQSDYLCLLNNDIEARDDAWLGEMLGRIAEPDVGAVGALLLWPSGVVQHGGVALGPRFAAAHAFNERLETDPGYADALRVAHEGSAVTAACLLTRRSDYLAAGGMDELRFPVNFNDVDYCLKLRAAGKRVVFTPHARLIHHESASRGTDRAPDRAGRFERELRTLRARWGDTLVNDPYYSPMLSLDAVPFSGLAWPPRPMTPRTNGKPVAVETPPGF